MDTKKKAFDAVLESRRWREAASAKLNAMSETERLAYLDALGESVRSKLLEVQAAKNASAHLVQSSDEQAMVWTETLGPW